jgi:hypothetical protein
MFYDGKLCYVPRGGVVLCVKNSNMITLYASDTVILIYVGGGPYRSKGTYCDPNPASVQFSLVCGLKLCRLPRKYSKLKNTFIT